LPRVDTFVSNSAVVLTDCYCNSITRSFLLFSCNIDKLDLKHQWCTYTRSLFPFLSQPAL